LAYAKRYSLPAGTFDFDFRSGSTVDESTWALTSYLVANAIVVPLTGWLANHFGRKRLLMLAIAGFRASSVLCDLAASLSMLAIQRPTSCVSICDRI
jgi:MFS family permease